MIELSISQNEYKGRYGSFPFTARVIVYYQNGAAINMDTGKTIIEGTYLREQDKPPCWATSTVKQRLAELNLVKLPMIIFDYVNIDRELTDVEKHNRQSMSKFFGVEDTTKNQELGIGKIYKQIETFKKAMKILKKPQMIRNMLPVDVNSIAFIVMKDTEEDFILSNEAKLISEAETINGNKFNIYILTEWE